MDTGKRQLLFAIVAGAGLAAAAMNAAAQERAVGSAVPGEMLVTFRPNVSLEQAEAIIRSAGLNVIGPPMVNGRVFHVRIPDPAQSVQVESRLRNTPGVQDTEPVRIVGVPPIR